MFKLEILDKYWLPGQPEETDLCLHGEVRVHIGAHVLQDEVSLSAAALHLLRTVKDNHEPDEYAKLFPTDGFCWTPWGDPYPIYLGGCPNGGIDGSVLHEDGGVRIELENLQEVRVALADYRTEVFRFADEVEGAFGTANPRLSRRIALVNSGIRFSGLSGNSAVMARKILDFSAKRKKMGRSPLAKSVFFAYNRS